MLSSYVHYDDILNMPKLRCSKNNGHHPNIHLSSHPNFSNIILMRY